MTWIIHRPPSCFYYKVLTGTAVTDIETYVDDDGKRRVKAVHTDNELSIQTDNIIVAGGSLFLKDNTHTQYKF